MKVTNTDIIKAREFYGIYDFVSDATVKRLIELVKIHGLDYVRTNTGILKKFSRKEW